MKLLKVFYLSLNSLKMFGACCIGRPHLLKIHQEQEAEVSHKASIDDSLLIASRDNEKDVPTCKILIMWRICLSCVFTLYFVFATYTSFSSEVEVYSKTLAVVVEINQFSDVSIIMISFIHIQVQGRKLFNMVESINASLNEFKHVVLEVPAKAFLTAVLLMILATIHLVSMHLVFLSKEFCPMLIIEMLDLLVFTQLKLSFCSLYWSCMNIIGCLYESIITELNDCIVGINEDNMKNWLQSSIPKDSPNEGKLICVTIENEIIRNEEKRTLRQPNSSSYCTIFYDDQYIFGKELDQSKHPKLLESIRSSYWRILKIYRARRQIHEYLGVPIALIMLDMIFAAVLAAFLLAYSSYLTPISILMVTGYAALTLSSGSILFLVPEIIIKKVRF